MGGGLGFYMSMYYGMYDGYEGGGGYMYLKIFVVYVFRNVGWIWKRRFYMCLEFTHALYSGFNAEIETRIIWILFCYSFIVDKQISHVAQAGR